MTIPTANTMIEALPYLAITFLTTISPTSDATKQTRANIAAVPACSMPSSRYWIADIDEENKTMNEHVAAVTCRESTINLRIQLLVLVKLWF
jgi:hypothetical protein